jgi:hypothetical protein
LISSDSISGITVDADPKSNIHILRNNIQLAGSEMRVIVAEQLGSVNFQGNNYFSDLVGTEWFRSNSISYDIDGWRVVTDPDDDSTVGPTAFPDSTRTFETYLASIGLASIDAFMEKAVAQSKTNWKTEFTAQPVLDYIRAGYGNLTCP